MKCIDSVFNGKEFVQVIYKGKPAYIATEVARVLDYAQIRNFSNIYRTRKPPLILGEEYENITGVQLARLKDLLHVHCKNSHRFIYTKKIVLLYTKGLLRCLSAVRGPLARQLADFIMGKKHVLPEQTKLQLEPLPKVVKNPSIINFEGVKLTMIQYKGKPAWIAQEVGEAMGYHEGSRLVKNVTGKWSAEFKRNKHFSIIEGTELSEFKRVLELGANMAPSRVLPRTQSLMLLFEEGINLAAMKTEKFIGIKLRDYLATEVLPQINKTGQYVPKPVVTDLPEVPRIGEDRVLLKKAANLFFKEEVTGPAAQSFALTIVEHLSGRDLTKYKPPIPLSWTPTELGEEFGVSAGMIGRVVSELGIRDDPKYGYKYLGNRKGVGGQVVCYALYEEGYHLVRQRLVEKGKCNMGAKKEGSALFECPKCGLVKVGNRWVPAPKSFRKKNGTFMMRCPSCY